MSRQVTIRTKFRGIHELMTEVLHCASGLAYEYFKPDLGEGDKEKEQMLDTWVNALYMATRRYLVARRQMRKKGL